MVYKIELLDGLVTPAWFKRSRQAKLPDIICDRSLTVFDTHPESGGKEVASGIYGGIGVVAWDCGFSRVWQGTGLKDRAVYMFGTPANSWAETAVRNYPEEFYQHRTPDAWGRFLPESWLSIPY